MARPKPLQVSHAPTGLLKEKIAGIGSRLMDVAGRAVQPLGKRSDLCSRRRVTLTLPLTQRSAARVSPRPLPVGPRDGDAIDAVGAAFGQGGSSSDNTATAAAPGALAQLAQHCLFVKFPTRMEKQTSAGLPPKAAQGLEHRWRV